MPALDDLHVTLIQSETHWHEPAKNRDLFERLMSDTPAQSQLIVLPEMFSTGFTMASRQVAETMDGPTVAWMREQACQRGLAICGSVVIEDDGCYYNRMVFADAQGQIQHYNKRHCFRMADEHRYYTPGDERCVVGLNGWRINLSVCYDLRFPVWLRNREDYDVLVCVANWPAARRTAWNTLLRARAIENQSYVVGVNILGCDGNDVTYSGGSAAYAPDGEVLGEYFDTAIVQTHILSRKTLNELRTGFPVWQDADRFQMVD
ncbi:MAG: amidohydrolase [Pseudomonadota bacterium]